MLIIYTFKYEFIDTEQRLKWPAEENVDGIC